MTLWQQKMQEIGQLKEIRDETKSKLITSQFTETAVGGLVTETGTVIILDWMKRNNLDFHLLEKSELLNVNLYIIIYIAVEYKKLK